MKHIVILGAMVIVMLSGAFLYMSSTVDAPNTDQFLQNELPKDDRDLSGISDLENPQEEDTPSLPPSEDVHELPDTGSVACTMDAKQCSDGSFVGRTGPDCSFSACPSEIEPVRVMCTEQMKSAQVCTEEYAPVCGLVQVQCITTPCNPVPETFSNGCSACAQGNVESYRGGECLLEVN